LPRPAADSSSWTRAGSGCRLGLSFGSWSEIPDRGCSATAVTNPPAGRSATDADATQRDRSCLGGAAVEPGSVLRARQKAWLDTAACRRDRIAGVGDQLRTDQVARPCRAPTCRTQRGDSAYPRGEPRAADRGARTRVRRGSSRRRDRHVRKPPQPVCADREHHGRAVMPTGPRGRVVDQERPVTQQRLDARPFAASSYPRSQVAPGLEARRAAHHGWCSTARRPYTRCPVRWRSAPIAATAVATRCCSSSSTSASGPSSAGIVSRISTASGMTPSRRKKCRGRCARKHRPVSSGALPGGGAACRLATTPKIRVMGGSTTRWAAPPGLLRR